MSSETTISLSLNHLVLIIFFFQKRENMNPSTPTASGLVPKVWSKVCQSWHQNLLPPAGIEEEAWLGTQEEVQMLLTEVKTFLQKKDLQLPGLLAVNMKPKCATVILLPWKDQGQVVNDNGRGMKLQGHERCHPSSEASSTGDTHLVPTFPGHRKLRKNRTIGLHFQLYGI